MSEVEYLLPPGVVPRDLGTGWEETPEYWQYFAWCLGKFLRPQAKQFGNPEVFHA